MVRLFSPWLRNQNHHCQRQIHTAHHQELQRIIQHGRVRTRCIDDRKDLVAYLTSIYSDSMRLFPGQHLVRIASDGIDFTVVHDEAVRMCTLPARVRVGAETGVYDCDGTDS